MEERRIGSSELGRFLREMRRTPGGPLITSKLIAAKIHSSSEDEAIKAFNVNLTTHLQ